MAGSQMVTRSVTNVAKAATYMPSYTGLAGFNVTFDPPTLTLKKGQTRKYAVIFTRTTALNAYTGGKIIWTEVDPGAPGSQNQSTRDTTVEPFFQHIVRIPVVINPVALSAPQQVSGSYNVKFGYDGPFSATGQGLVPATTFSGSINTGESLAYTVVVPAGATYARFSLFDTDVAPASDLDLYVYLGPTQVGGSGGGTSEEEVNLLNPAAGTYTVYVDGFGTANPSTFTLFTWVLDATPYGNMTVTAPTTAVMGVNGAINLAFSGLLPATKYLGSVTYSGAAGMPNPTIVRVDTPNLKRSARPCAGC